MTTPYDSSFYEARLAGSKRSAEIVLPLLLKRHPAKSAVDVGCGTGAWLRTFMDLGATDIQGFDGEYVDRTQLQIPSSAFSAVDLTHPLPVPRRYDIALCLEVGEHLPTESARSLVKSLTSFSEVVLFSAAAPGQGGTNHINEQWPAYWAEHFRACGYRSLDCIRSAIWENKEVDWWYAQNTILYASEEAIRKNPKLTAGQVREGEPPMALVHPYSFARVDTMLIRVENNTWGFGLRWAVKACVRAFRVAFAKKLRGDGAKPE